MIRVKKFHMKLLKINFADFWPDFDYKEWLLYRVLSNMYEIEISDQPDYLFCSNFGYSHWRYQKCIKIYYTGENLVPDFNIFDYGISFHYLDFGDRHLRFPLWLLYAWDQLDAMERKEVNQTYPIAKKFCNFVYSNAGWTDPIRTTFFHALSRYKKVDSGGGYLNNIGYRVPNKLDFIKDYKFTIAIENSASPGYTTEKLIEPMMVNSIPIYYGDPHVGREFNVDSFVHLRSFPSMGAAIERIIQLNEDDTLYCDMLKEQWFTLKNIRSVYELRLKSFFENIFNPDIEEAKRIIPYGFAKRYRKEMRRVTPWTNSFLVEKLYGICDRFNHYI